MVRKICLDSDVIISLLNKDVKTKELLESLDAEFYTTVINSFEVWYGRKESESMFQFLESLNVLELDQRSSLVAADALRELKKQGRMIEFRDLFIAGVCIVQGIELLTFNKKHFERMKDFGLILASI